MKINRAIPTAILAAGIILSASACAPSDDKKAESSSSPSAEQSVTASPEATVKTDERVDVAATVNDFYTYVSDPENATKIVDAGTPLKGHGGSATDAELKTLADALPDGFRYFDTSSPALIRNAYVQLLMGSSIMSKGTMTVHVPEAAVTVNDKTATVDSTKLDITLNGEKTPVPSSSASQVLNMKKDAAGQWVMIADDFAQPATEKTTK